MRSRSSGIQGKIHGKQLPIFFPGKTLSLWDQIPDLWYRFWSISPFLDGNLTISDISRDLGIPISSLSKLLSKLHSYGLIHYLRDESSDPSWKLPKITPLGRELLERYEDFLAALMQAEIDEILFLSCFLDLMESMLRKDDE